MIDSIVTPLMCPLVQEQFGVEAGILYSPAYLCLEEYKWYKSHSRLLDCNYKYSDSVLNCVKMFVIEWKDMNELRP